MRRFCAALLLAAFVAAPAGATPPKLKPLAQRIVTAGATGAVVYVRDPGGVRAAAAGRADVRRKKALTPAMAFRVGSITKTFAAVVALQLAAEGKLSLEDTVERWLPGLVPGGAGITVRQLLNHTSGLYNYTEDSAFLAAALSTRSRVWTPRELVAAAVRHPPLFQPAARWSYSNTNYILVGLIVEAASGRSFGEELKARVLDPAGLTRTVFPTSAAMPAPFAHGYVEAGNPLGIPLRGARRVDVTAWHPSWAWAAGAVVSTADDLGRFYSALLGGRLLGSASVQELVRTVRVAEGAEYGLGIFVVSGPCGPAWGHDGSVPGYLSVVSATRDGSHVAIVLVNESIGLASEQRALGRAIDSAFCGR